MAMDKQSDLIQDSKLDTWFDSGFTVHVYQEVSTSSGRKVELRKEYWRRVSLVGAGSYGRVWLEKCVQGHRDVEIRAVKQVSIRPLGTGTHIDYGRELEAIAKFSHNKVSAKYYRSSLAKYIC
jgi:hypothetical protein